ncbi:P-loop containing nucleoside triphosphate hydrolase protein [Parathielavia appendiculata]|uniref:ATP-dependent RNA helicase n=1 Tax=Parathielavia appendiculata TaxID=2587402 RepID=A0AAN6TXW8_9PEZI|nr:P-loop containing nucleoside triphosphate hydrolase protein [Parathielavia appendiculata]
MYNRYIPPPKEKPASNNSQAIPASYSAPFSSSQPYARYIPGPTSSAEPAQRPPAQPQRIVFDDADLPPVDHTKRQRIIDEELTGTREDKKAKNKSKSKKSTDEGKLETEEDGEESQLTESKSRKRKRGEEEPAAIPEKEIPEGSGTTTSNGVAAPEVETADPAAGERKLKREKKKKRKQQDNLDSDMADGDADHIRKRHRSVFEKVQKALQAKPDVDVRKKEEDKEEEDTEPVVEHGLEPLPQPEPFVLDESRLTYETLPPWLASPIKVTADMTRPFTELGISPESSKVLESKGFKEAFAVQTAVLPLLLPSPDRQGDVVVAAPTGSGKTLSYVLPMVYDISKGRVTRLRALIVLPTRDLVQQVQLACESCAAAFAINGAKRVKIGTAMGNRVFMEEQSVIMGEEQIYDPKGYEQYLKKQDSFVDLEDSDMENDDLGFERAQPFPYHVIAYTSKVDILICTPGRLVEHITKTPGFSLDYVRWLIVDEADKLLAQHFQQWLDIVTDKLSVVKPGARDFPGSNKSCVRKVILSATMTRDLSLLNGLKLSRPKLVVVEGTKAGEQSLPPLLKEFAIKIREPSLKPLYLVDLLHSEHMASVNPGDVDEASEGSETSDVESPSSSDSDSGSDSDSDADASASPGDDDDHSQPSKFKPPIKQPKLATTILIFTKSNEAALRLSRLLALLAPDLTSLIGTLTSSTKTSRRARTLRAFAQGKLRILVASDLVSRGIDLLNLEHVINYDVPISETSYVHRVGRTARAGRKGCAWTLLEHAEARRFWRDFAGEGKGAVTSIVRAGKVERVRVGPEGGEFEEERVKEYEAALERLRLEAQAVGRK